MRSSASRQKNSAIAAAAEASSIIPALSSERTTCRAAGNGQGFWRDQSIFARQPPSINIARPVSDSLDSLVGHLRSRSGAAARANPTRPPKHSKQQQSQAQKQIISLLCAPPVQSVLHGGGASTLSSLPMPAMSGGVCTHPRRRKPKGGSRARYAFFKWHNSGIRGLA